MKQAVFITGFNNWGKTWTIQELFDDRQRFAQGWRYRLTGICPNTDFTVESHSNDDFWGSNWINLVQNRINNSTDNGQNLFTALCPTLHTNNNFVDLLRTPLFAGYDRLHIFLLEYKWEHHAKLMIDNITDVGRQIPNANFIVINADANLVGDDTRREAKINQIRNELAQIFP